MAILFTSPKKRRRIFLWSITLLLILLLFMISLIIFPPQFRNELQSTVPEGVFDMLNTKINFNIMDSNQVKNLDPFEDVETEFTYIAQDKDGKQITGRISAVSKIKAESILEEMGFKVFSLQESDIGRNEPFIPYYQPTTKTTTKK